MKKVVFDIAVWFMFLTFPIMVIRVNTIYKTVEWRWRNLLYRGYRQFSAFFRAWRYLMIARKETGRQALEAGDDHTRVSLAQRIMDQPRIFIPLQIVFAGFILIFSVRIFQCTRPTS